MRLVVVFGISFHPAGVFLRMKSRDIVSGGGRAGIAAGAGIAPYGGFRGGGRRHEGLGVLLSVSPYAGVRPRGETL